MSEEILVTILNISVPCATGAFLAIIGLAGKFPNRMKYVSRSLATWVYILLSSGLSLLFTFSMEVIGTRVVAVTWLNSILLGIIGPGVFLGVLSRLPSPGTSNTDVENQLKNLRDYVFDYLEKSIDKKITEIVGLMIESATTDIVPENLMRAVRSIIDGERNLTDEQRRELRVKLDEKAEYRKYDEIIQELEKYQSIDYIIKRLSPKTEQEYVRIKLRNLVKVALATHEARQALVPEFIIAKVQALQKAPDSSLYYLKQALQKKPSLKGDILINKADWWILVSMTSGERQQEKLETLLGLIDVKQLSIEDIKKKCMHQDCHSIKFIAVKRNNGDGVEITLRKAQDNQSHTITWWITSDGVGKECTNLDEAINHITAVAIPIQLA